MKSALYFLAVAGLAVTPGLSWASTRVQPRSTEAQTQPRPEQQTFTGVISRNPDRRDHQEIYVLYDANRKTNLFVDDRHARGSNRMIEGFANHKVEIKGTLEGDNNTIQVQSVKKLD